MSRSKRRPYLKDKGLSKQKYWRPIRRTWKQSLHKNWDNPDLILKNPKAIVNDYDYCDWWFYCDYDEEMKIKYSRK